MHQDLAPFENLRANGIRRKIATDLFWRRSVFERVQPDDLVRQIVPAVLRGESEEPAQQFRRLELVGHDNSAMGPACLSPGGGKTEIVWNVEREDRAALACSEGQLLRIRLAEIAGLSSRETVNAADSEHVGEERLNVFVEIELHAGGKKGCCLQRYTGNRRRAWISVLAAMSASTSSRLS